MHWMLLLLCVGLAGTATPGVAKQAALIGTVLEDSTERPITNAEVLIAALKRSVRSDSAGNFTFGSIPAGVYRVTVRAVGRVGVEETVVFDVNGRVERDYLLARSATTLATVNVTAEANVEASRMAEFNARRALGIGRFLTQDELAKTEGRKLSDVLASRIPGLRSVSIGGTQRAMVSTRGTVTVEMRSRRNCYVQVIVDRMIRYNDAQTPFDINTIEPETIAGVEYYTTSQIPGQFNNTGTPCGTLVIWTRMR